MKIKNMRIGKIQRFLQKFFRECKKDFDKNSEKGLWDEFIASLCCMYADESENFELQRLASRIRETNIAYFIIPSKNFEEVKKNAK